MIQTTMTGHEELIATFKRLPNLIKVKAIKSAARKVNKEMRAHVAAKLPSKTGTLKNNITVRVKVRPKYITSRVGIKADVYYAYMLQHGWKTGKRRSSNRHAVAPKIDIALTQADGELARTIYINELNRVIRADARKAKREFNKLAKGLA